MKRHLFQRKGRKDAKYAKEIFDKDFVLFFFATFATLRSLR
jgi:hypothetical protein